MSSRVTMSDVAREAGVSLMTVSRVINDKEDVSAETRERVLKVIASLDYRPSAIARSLATQETRTIGLVIPDVTNPFFADVTRGVDHLAYAQGYHVFLCNSEEDPQRELALILSLEEKRVDGLILCSSRIEDKVLVDLLSRLPVVVLINRTLNPVGEDYFQSIVLNDVQAGMLATQHLLRTGHQQIGFLAGPPVSFSGQRRKLGYEAALQAAGLPPHPEWVIHCPPTVEGGDRTSYELLLRCPELTALFCYNDLVAIGALHACAQLGRSVPGDIAVVGHDDIPTANLVTPSLTTCRVARHELGSLAVQALMERLKDCPTGCHQILLEPELVIRNSAP